MCLTEIEGLKTLLASNSLKWICASTMFNNSKGKYKLGDLKTSEKLIAELYIELRKRVNFWSSITNQTSQARMGYVGQHLTSVVTGYKGGKSGARGKDLVIDDERFAEIKTCYRVDQLGKCQSCRATVLPIETKCPSCGGDKIIRNDDSKWLIGIRNDEEFEHIIDPTFYYLVLFDFEELDNPRNNKIVSQIWRVDSKAPGFWMAMVDYYKNIRAESTSKAPFNLWPYQLKFHLMRPTLIYKSIINPDDTMNTIIFPGINDEIEEKMPTPSVYYRATNLTDKVLEQLAESLSANIGRNKLSTLENIYQAKERRNMNERDFIDLFATILYRDKISPYLTELPHSLKQKIGLRN